MWMINGAIYPPSTHHSFEKFNPSSFLRPSSVLSHDIDSFQVLLQFSYLQAFGPRAPTISFSKSFSTFSKSFSTFKSSYLLSITISLQVVVHRISTCPSLALGRYRSLTVLEFRIKMANRSALPELVARIAYTRLKILGRYSRKAQSQGATKIQAPWHNALVLEFDGAIAVQNQLLQRKVLLQILGVVTNYGIRNKAGTHADLRELVLQICRDEVDWENSVYRRLSTIIHDDHIKTLNALEYTVRLSAGKLLKDINKTATLNGIDPSSVDLSTLQSHGNWIRMTREPDELFLILWILTPEELKRATVSTQTIPDIALN